MHLDATAIFGTQSVNHACEVFRCAERQRHGIGSRLLTAALSCPSFAHYIVVMPAN